MMLLDKCQKPVAETKKHKHICIGIEMIFDQ